jgi:hypothetical protein
VPAPGPLVDLLVLGQRRLHLVELKYYRGTLRGDDHRWLRDGHRAEDSPLKLARRKAQRLASRLRTELTTWGRENRQAVPDHREVIPFGSDRFDNRVLRLDDGVTRGTLRSAQRAIRDRDGGTLDGMMPEVYEDALRQLKFAEFLPPDLAQQTLAARIADTTATARVIEQPVALVNLGDSR